MSWPPRHDPAFCPAAGDEYWSAPIECAPSAERDILILAKLQAQVAWAWDKSAFYRRKWQAAGVTPATLRTLDDLARFPVVRKDELRQAQAANPRRTRASCGAPACVRETRCTEFKAQRVIDDRGLYRAQRGDRA